MNQVLVIVFGLVVAGVACAAEPAAQPPVPAAAVLNPWVTTDKSIDCSTVDNIVKGLVTKEMTDEQKALACYNWVRRVIYHGDGPVKYAYNLLNMVNVQGNGSCLRQTTPMWVLLSRLGYKCRTGAVDGHHIIEVQYGGKWHLFDPHTTFYVYDRARPPTIASIEQISADPTLATDAVKDGRACPGFLLCGDPVSMFTDGKKYQIVGDFPESRKYTPTIEEPFGRIALRRGETYIRTWMPGTYWFKANAWKKDQGPSHGCGLSRDAKDTVNLPLYEPHAAGRTYRHWGAGYLVYKPDLTTDHYADAVVEQKNVVAGKKGETAGLVAPEGGGLGEITFSVNCPYVITAGELTCTALGGGVTVAVSTDSGKTWKPVDAKAEKDALAATFVDEVNGSFQGYLLRLAIPAGSGIASLTLKTHFQLNPYSLPYLVPGRNVIDVKAERVGSPVTLEWKYAEGPDWKEEKTAGGTFDKAGRMEVEVKGEKHPRNVSLTLSVAP